MSSEANKGFVICSEFMTRTYRPAGFLSLRERREVREILLKLSQNSSDGFAGIFVSGDRPADYQIISAGFNRFERRHESLLIARLRPARSNSWNDNFDLVAEFGSQRFDFAWTRHDSVDPIFNAKFCQSHHLFVECVRNSRFAQRFFG